ncbi:adenylate cyclase associated N terminal-domain-containing protein [Mycotypha africana]|uniref:adenylate cyclase associated N terminal-domain-containing protein n=1 Tax=Mycotypha africana TaxID=64632 RepID=UPI00230059CD|nr:adenylate cyclase associated N terminal-domain-containing protein [Mycotypha africana]KAI8983954.1 adenylate cyclase associated N terminal-domain-containing protein [Mycotypha africana]
MSEFHSLANLIKRLEVATTRLEDLAMSSSSATTVVANMPSSPQKVPATVTSTAAPVNTETSPMVEKHDAAVNSFVEKYMSLSQEIGGVVAEQSRLVKEALNAERDIVQISTMAQKPDMASSTFMKLLEPIQKAMTAIMEIKDANRPDPLFNHLSTVAEGIPALGWFTCEPTPVPFIRDIKDAAQFYSNRVIKEFREKEPMHVEWVKAFLGIIENLAAYVKENFPTGLSWNAQGEKADTYIGKLPSSTANNTNTSTVAPPAPSVPSAGAPPPPPPPPPPMMLDDNDNKSAPQPSGAAAVFAEINQGSSITSHLRKVDKNEMTHKNPNLRANSSVNVAAPSSPKRQGPPTPNKPNKYTIKKPAKTSLEANKWVIENHENNHEIVLEETAMNQSVYIYNCKNSTIRIKGKVNAVTIDSCAKTGVALDSTVATVDLVNSKSFALQVFKVVPTIAVDKCDSGEIYLSRECLDVEILSAKSSSLNILVPESDAEDSEFKEMPVPEQLKTTIVDGKLVTATVEHAG